MANYKIAHTAVGDWPQGTIVSDTEINDLGGSVKRLTEIGAIERHREYKDDDDETPVKGASKSDKKPKKDKADKATKVAAPGPGGAPAETVTTTEVTQVAEVTTTDENPATKVAAAAADVEPEEAVPSPLDGMSLTVLRAQADGYEIPDARKLNKEQLIPLILKAQRAASTGDDTDDDDDTSTDDKGEGE